MTRQFSRRTILRGLGAAVSTPWLESSLLGAPKAAVERLSEPPLRMACLFMPNGVRPEHWTPAGDGEQYELTPHLEPLRALKDDFLLLENLWN
jgi:hypothetical protein